MKDTDHPLVSTAVLVLIAYLIRLALHPVLGNRSPWLLFTVAIVIAAGRYGASSGLIAMAISLVAGLVTFVGLSGWSSLPAESIASLLVFLVTGAAMLLFAQHLKASQERTMRLQAQLQQADARSAVGAIASTLAHELNQPLAAASNYIVACKRFASRLHGDEKEALASGLAHSEAQIQRAGAIIREARELVRNVSTKRERASLKQLVDRVTVALRAGGQCENASIRTEIDGAADDLRVNPIQVEQVLMNLLRNAGQAASGPANITVTAWPDGDWSTIVVRDRSGGIAPEALKTIFSGEVTPRGERMGLGLSISQTIVEAHGGRIWAENNSEGGASFFFRLPRSSDATN